MNNTFGNKAKEMVRTGAPAKVPVKIPVHLSDLGWTSREKYLATFVKCLLPAAAYLSRFHRANMALMYSSPMTFLIKRKNNFLCLNKPLRCFQGAPFITTIASAHMPHALETTSKSKLNATVSTTSSDSSLLDDLRQIYKTSSTDGVISFAKNLLAMDARQVLQLAIQAGDESPGNMVSILHALQAGFHSQGKPQLTAQLFQLILQQNTVHADLVTCSLTYAACFDAKLKGDITPADLAFFDNVAQMALELASRIAKKAGGKSRRKQLAKSKHVQHVSALQVQDQLLLKYGIQVIYESDSILGLIKPAGMAVHHEKRTPAGKSKDVSLDDALTSLNIPLSDCSPLSGRGIVHRLDRGTSGCIILAKNDETHLRLVSAIFRRCMKKSYLALVQGVPSRVQREEEMLPSASDSGSDSASSIEFHVHRRLAKSRFQTVQIFENSDASLLKVYTETGRKHQVRVHCASALNCPIFLDDVYFPKSKMHKVPPAVRNAFTNEKPGHRFFLHAATLEIPSFGIELEAPIPQWWKQVIEKL